MDALPYADGDSYQDLQHLSPLQDKQEKIIEIKYASLLVHRQGRKSDKRILHASDRKSVV